MKINVPKPEPEGASRFVETDLTFIKFIKPTSPVKQEKGGKEK